MLNGQFTESVLVNKGISRNAVASAVGAGLLKKSNNGVISTIPAHYRAAKLKEAIGSEVVAGQPIHHLNKDTHQLEPLQVVKVDGNTASVIDPKDMTTKTVPTEELAVTDADRAAAKDKKPVAEPEKEKTPSLVGTPSSPPSASLSTSPTIGESHNDSFVRDYLITALWSSTDSDGEPLDKGFSIHDLSDEAKHKAQKDCSEFLDKAYELISAAIETGEVKSGPDFDEWGRAAHDFWLTRNGHGAGFWDGDWPEPYDQKLTDIAKSFGSCDLYVGDDGKLHMT